VRRRGDFPFTRAGWAVERVEGSGSAAEKNACGKVLPVAETREIDCDPSESPTNFLEKLANASRSCSWLRLKWRSRCASGDFVRRPTDEKWGGDFVKS